MEYSFGMNGSEEFIRIKGISKGFALQGFQTITIPYSDSIVTHSFRVKGLIKMTDDYAWYAIDNHVKVIDKTPKLEAENKKLRAMVEYLSMMTNVELEDEQDEQRIS